MNIFFVFSCICLFLSFLILRKKKQEIKILKKQEFHNKETLQEKQQELFKNQIEISKLRAQIEEKEKYYREKIQETQDIEKRLKESFQSLSSEVLAKNNQSFLELAKLTLEKYQKEASSDLEKKEKNIQNLFVPMKESLSRLDKGMQELEKERKVDHETIKTQMQALVDAEKGLRQETATLVRALRTPVVRGRWGEMQLKRVFELAGMIEHCDFYEQKSSRDEEGLHRPDVIIRLPGNKQIIVDAKVPFETYLDALETEDEEEKKKKLQIFANLVRRHVSELGRKAYWQKFQPSPEFVVLFLPAETFFSSALQADPALIEAGIDQGVIIATPTSLIGLLRAIAYGWKQEALSQNAKQISEIGHELYERIAKLGEHFTSLGKSLEKSISCYNQAVGTLESRILVSARKLKEMQSAYQNVEVSDIEPIDKIPREFKAKELTSEKPS
ncbi:MAG: DNA recombination protein RmuC [Simkaniaceae bacterium]